MHTVEKPPALSGKAREISMESRDPSGITQDRKENGETADTDLSGRIANVEQLRGLVVYGAVLVFAALFTYMSWKIWTAGDGDAPTFGSAMVSAAMALAGVLGSAFALVMGVPNKSEDVNERLKRELAARDDARRLVAGTPLTPIEGVVPSDSPKTTDGSEPPRRYTPWNRLRWWTLHAFSVKPGGVDRVSHPLTAGIWVYVVVAAGVALTYFLHPDETPDVIQGMATAFAGYVLAVLFSAYGVRSRSS